MQYSLNFSKEEKGKVKEWLSRFPARKTNTAFEETRVEVGKSIVTLYSSGKLLVQGEDAENIKQELMHNIDVSGELLLGIDETGRGENFGSFVVAGVLGNTNKLRGLRDSKKIKGLETAREEVLRQSEDQLVLFKSASEIDSLREKGSNMNEIEAKMIVEIVQNFRKKGFKGRILVDGSRLKEVPEGVEFLVKGDDLNPVIGAASVLAKTARDNSKDKAIRKSWKNS
ncbi:MAG: hypothetical protein QGI60_00225 [archaeon]|nr:hypothetical protein [archaeon]